MIARLEEAVRGAIQSEIKQMHTMCPGKVLAYDAATQTARVELSVRRRLRDPDTSEVVYDPPVVIPNCPVAFPSGGGMSITFPLDPGDPVVVLFAERSLSEWKASPNDNAKSPFDGRVFNAADAIVIPGAPSPARALSGDAWDSGAVVIKAGEVKLGDATAAQALAKASAVEAKLNELILVFNLHTHASLLLPPPAVTPPPVPVMTTVPPGSLGSSVAKVTT
jgi:hypothetical protein